MTGGTRAHEASFAATEALWNAWTAVHSTGEFYDLQGFKAGGVRIRPYEIEMIGGWARVVAHFLAPGGTFFITEIHPVAQVFENEGVQPGELRLTYPYWEHAEPLTFEVKGSYADPTADVGDLTEHGWDHGLGEIVTALIDAGLQIETLVEHPSLDWKADFLVEDDEGKWRLPPDARGELPLMFSLVARKPA